MGVCEAKGSTTNRSCVFQTVLSYIFEYLADDVEEICSLIVWDRDTAPEPCSVFISEENNTLLATNRWYFQLVLIYNHKCLKFNSIWPFFERHNQQTHLDKSLFFIMYVLVYFSRFACCRVTLFLEFDYSHPPVGRFWRCAMINISDSNHKRFQLNVSRKRKRPHRTNCT